jgi:hypothetical protein
METENPKISTWQLETQERPWGSSSKILKVWEPGVNGVSSNPKADRMETQRELIFQF